MAYQELNAIQEKWLAEMAEIQKREGSNFWPRDLTQDEESERYSVLQELQSTGYIQHGQVSTDGLVHFEEKLRRAAEAERIEKERRRHDWRITLASSIASLAVGIFVGRLT